MTLEEIVGYIMRTERAKLMKKEGIHGWETEALREIQPCDAYIGLPVVACLDMDLMVATSKKLKELRTEELKRAQKAVAYVKLLKYADGFTINHRPVDLLGDAETYVGHCKKQLAEITKTVRETISGKRNPKARAIACKIADFFLEHDLVLKNSKSGGQPTGPFTRCVDDVLKACELHGSWHSAAKFAVDRANFQDPHF